MSIAFAPEYESYLLPPRNTGASHCAEKLDDIVKEAYSHISKPVFRHANVGELYTELNDLLSECSNVNWDGYGAMPITTAALLDAVMFISSMPKWLPHPEIVPENTGDIGFQWDFGKRKKFAVSLRGNNSISYAGLLGAGSKISGKEGYNGVLPKTILDNIKRIIT